MRSPALAEVNARIKRETHVWVSSAQPHTIGCARCGAFVQLPAGIVLPSQRMPPCSGEAVR